MSKLDNGYRLAKLALLALEEVARLLKRPTPVDVKKVDKALRAFKAFVTMFAKGVDGKATVAAVEEALARLKKGLGDNDDAADETLKKRFRKS